MNREQAAPEAGIVVGVDGTTTSLRAVGWATHEARTRHLPLTIAHAAPYATDGDGRRRAAAILQRAFTVARRAGCDGVAIHTESVDGPILGSLREMAAGSVLLVVGMMDGDVEDALLGSHALALAGHTRCPLVVVRGEVDTTTPGRPVVLGVADAAADAAAVTVAFGAAHVHATRLVAVHAGSEPGDTRALASALAPWRARFPEVGIELAVESGPPVEVLVDRARGALLAVVGTHGRGLPGRALLGSTSRALLRSGPCPVCVVPGESTAADRFPVRPPYSATHPHAASELW